MRTQTYAREEACTKSRITGSKQCSEIYLYQNIKNFSNKEERLYGRATPRAVLNKNLMRRTITLAVLVELAGSTITFRCSIRGEMSSRTETYAKELISRFEYCDRLL